ncbi:alpha-2-macroglobulin family protein [Halothermothrix orenii]|uniref:Alpha-2-macroglobulin domain protein n=1 Tax=Halothermothrix orenii (strain H 168 / OCM 544 / DSM 9562) TaxID=373903 RepID=B8CWQ3_HALOH|nr:alpha-2-macroglobulin [Halothermothrix orenii]ACL69722.1 alpha-2-macroglobulin domain protein [Halothermothrix orenii H 168]
MEDKQRKGFISKLPVCNNKEFGKGFVAGLLVALILVGVVALFFSGKVVEVINFASREEVKVIKHPEGEVDPRANLYIKFSKKIVDNNIVGNTISDGMVRLKPFVPGSYRWIKGDELCFLPEEPLNPSTEYELIIKPGVIKSDQYRLNGEKRYTFQTGRFKVLSFKIDVTDSWGEWLKLEGKLSFNYPVSFKELEKYLRLYLYSEKEGEISSLNYYLKPSSDSNEFKVIVHRVKLEDKNHKIKLLINKGLTCKDGGQGLLKDYVKLSRIINEDPIKVGYIRTQSGFNQGEIRIDFSNPVEEESIEAFVTVTPEVPYNIEVAHDDIYLISKEFKPGRVFTVTLKKGLPSKNAAPLARNYTRNLRIPDLDPVVRFKSPGYYLSKKGNKNIVLETVNIDEVDMSIYKIYPNNLVHFLPDSPTTLSKSRLSHLGKVVKEFTLKTNGDRNELKKSIISLAGFIEKEGKGIYQIDVRDRDHYWRSASKIVLATDIGIVTKVSEDELLVWVNSLRDLNSISDVEVTLLSVNNQVICKGRTNNRGLVRFNGLEDKIKDLKPYIVLAEKGNDFSFLRLSHGRVDLTDFDIEGRQYLDEGFEGYLYTDRGVYRPGDKTNIAAIIRGDGGVDIGQLPVKLEVLDPAGNIYSELVKKTGAVGQLEFNLDLPNYVKTGKYTANLYIADNIIGSTEFNVEEFVPDRLKVSIKSNKNSYKSGDKAKIIVKGLNLYGPPASGRKVELSVNLNNYKFTPPGYRSYSFGTSDSDLKVKDRQISSGSLNKEGVFSYMYSFPEGYDTGNMVKAVFKATVKEEGGRAVSAYYVVGYHPYDYYIGLRPGREKYAKINEPYPIKFVVVSPDGKKVTVDDLTVKVYRIISHGIWKKASDGHWYYESNEEKSELLTKDLEVNSSEGEFIYNPPDYGRYEVVISDRDTGSKSSLSFYATGWGYSPWALTNPNKIGLTFDKTLYNPGDIARIQVKAPFSGKALVTVEREKILETRIIEVKENSALLRMKVKENWKPNVYISVQLIRELKPGEERMPLRAFGTSPLRVNSNDQRLKVSINSKGELRPDSKARFEIEVDGVKKETYVAVAAVDEGILQLTSFKTPSPFQFFYGKKSLEVKSYDLYNMVLPEVERVISNSSPAGGESRGFKESIRKDNLNPISVARVKPVSLWSGFIKVNNEGKADIEFELPQFNGSLRVMAVAVSEDRYGSIDKNVLVRDPLVIKPTFPRFVAPEDSFVVPVNIFNASAGPGEFNLELLIDGPARLTGKKGRTIKLDQGEETMVYYRVKAGKASGKLKFKLKVTGNNVETDYDVELPVRPASQRVNEIVTGQISPDDEIDLKLPEGWFKGTDNYVLTVSPFPEVKFSESLSYLLNYPYGCLEQTVSSVFPLLYFNDLARTAEPELFEDESHGYYIKEGITKIQSMQNNDGSFSFWPYGNLKNTWASVYASHFLVEAKKAGYEVSNRVYDRMLRYLQYVSRLQAITPDELQTKVYALYVLSLAGEPDVSSMAYLKNHQMGSLYQDSRALLAAAYYLAGKREESKELLPYQYNPPVVERQTGSNFNSAVRSRALILLALTEINPVHPSIPVLVDDISEEASSGRWGTTQENAFALLAIGKALDQKGNEEYTGQLYLDGTEIGNFNQKKQLVIKDKGLGGKKITITMEGKGTAYYYARASGIPELNKIIEKDNGIKVTRKFYNKAGDEIDTSEIIQGELIIAEITVEADRNKVNNVVVVDMLPAGLEIENPRLGSRSRLEWAEESTLPIEYQDIRDDRLLLFTTIKNKGRKYKYYYTLRAVTAGEFTLPPVKAECMYEPELNSISSSGQIKVIRGK